MSIGGIDIAPVAQDYLARAAQAPDDAELWMNLSIALQCIGQRDLGVSMQGLALEIKRVFDLPAARPPARCRLLMLMMPGDLAENTPLECLLENSDIDLVFYYATPAHAFPSPVPEHDVLLVGMADSAANQQVLDELERTLANWPKPVINLPRAIKHTERSVASAALQNVPGILMPPTRRIGRAALAAIGAGQAKLADFVADCDFPVILRPVGSQAGRDLDRFDSPDAIPAYLERVAPGEATFFIAPFIDYRGPDGLFRKARVALIDGQPFACHMALSTHWMIHYVNANMYEDAWKRSEELCFMEQFDAFAKRHQAALAAIHQRTGLDYLCLDCAEMPDGRLLIFELDHVMVVHAMDSESLFPYKQVYMQKVKDAFRDYLLHLTADPRPVLPA